MDTSKVHHYVVDVLISLINNDFALVFRKRKASLGFSIGRDLNLVSVSDERRGTHRVLDTNIVGTSGVARRTGISVLLDVSPVLGSLDTDEELVMHVLVNALPAAHIGALGRHDALGRRVDLAIVTHTPWFDALEFSDSRLLIISFADASDELRLKANNRSNIHLSVEIFHDADGRVLVSVLIGVEAANHDREQDDHQEGEQDGQPDETALAATGQATLVVQKGVGLLVVVLDFETVEVREVFALIHI